MPPALRKIADWLGLASGLYFSFTVGIGIVGGSIAAALAAARSVSPAFLVPIAIGVMLILVAVTGGAIRRLSPLAGPSDRRYYHREKVSLPAIADEFSTIRNVTFDDCDIEGPALVLIAEITLRDNKFNQGGFATYLEIRDDQPMPTGLLKMPGCTITGSRIRRVGLVGTPQVIAIASAGMTNRL